jgi:hypothetical protein
MVRWLALAGLTLLSMPASAADLTPDQKSAICGTRASCRTTLTDAGAGAQQERLTVVEARFDTADKPAEAMEQGCINDSGAENAPDYDGGHEYWLIAGDAAPKRLLALCNDGYGSAGMGEDSVSVGPNAIAYHQSGGSSWRWGVTKKIRLSPLAVTHEISCSYHNVTSVPGQVTEVDRLTLKARSVGPVAGHKFGEEDGVGCPDWPTDAASTLPTGPEIAGGYAVLMPNAGDGQDGLGEAYPDGIVLGNCALELSTDGLQGFMVHGKPIDEGAAILRVIKETESSLLIQVFDPSAAAELKAAKAKSWVGQPHIEIWVAEMGNPEDNDGENGETYAFRQFAIGLDGKTYPGANAFSPLPKVTHWAAQDEAGHDVTVYRVKWESDENRPSFGLGVVYSQAKDGKQVRMVSNAQIKKNKPLYLPDAWLNMPEDSGIPSGSCAVTAEKRLELVKG